LQVTLTFWEGDPHVEFALMRGGEAADKSGRIWRIQAQSLSVPASLRPNTQPELHLPQQLVEGLRTQLERDPKTLPLWIRFAKPHGYLGVLPWENALTEVLARPVLRLPDLLEPLPHAYRESLEVALCFDPSPETPQEKATEQITNLVDTIVRASPRSQTHIHVFTTAAWLKRLHVLTLDNRLRIHDPSTALTSRELVRRKLKAEEQALPEKRSERAGPWTLWISESLEGRSLDAVHIICRADIAYYGPALVISSSPSPNEPVQTLSYVGAVEAAAALTRIGAWAALFSPSSDSPSGVALALFADALAHLQPISALYHPLLTPMHLSAIQLAYAFLFSPHPSCPPTLRDGFLYCQPTSVAAYAHLLDVAQPSAAALENINPKQLPNWAGALQRHIEAVALEDLRRRSPDVMLASPESARSQLPPNTPLAGSKNVDKVFDDIRKIMNDYLRNSAT
jgi:hypothetical protein